MDATDIEKNVTYLSIHDVPYRVLGIDAENNVRAQAVVGKSRPFLMSMERFAETMKCTRC